MLKEQERENVAVRFPADHYAMKGASDSAIS